MTKSCKVSLFCHFVQSVGCSVKPYIYKQNKIKNSTPEKMVLQHRLASTLWV